MNFRTSHLSKVAVLAALAVAGCDTEAASEAAREEIENLDALNVIDESNLNDLMLNFADPNQSVIYFQRGLASDPGRVDFQRGLAKSLLSAKRPAEAASVYGTMEEKGNLNSVDRLKYAEALIQTGEWSKAQAQLGKVPPTVESYERYKLEAMVADNRKEWQKADTYYQQAREKTTRPASIYNNWGISKIARGDRGGAEEMFIKAISYDSSMFSAKNNLAISRATRKVYDLPIVPMTKAEEAELLHNIALQAIRNGDIDIGRGLLERAIETHPRHFEEASNKLAALNSSVVR